MMSTINRAVRGTLTNQISRSNVLCSPTVTLRAARRRYATLADNLPHQIGALAVFGPTTAYLLTPAASTHSSTSHAHPVPDKWARSFDENDLKAESLNRPIISDEDGVVPAGEGRPHGPGDKALRQITTSTDTHADKQVSMGIAEPMRAIPEKMEEARAQSADRAKKGMDTKSIVAKAHVSHDDKHN